MLKFGLTKAFVLTILGAGLVLSRPAAAMPLGAQAGIHSAIDALSAVEQAACWPWGWGGWGWYPPSYPRSWALDLGPCSYWYHPPSHRYRVPHGRPYLRPGWWW